MVTKLVKELSFFHFFITLFQGFPTGPYTEPYESNAYYHVVFHEMCININPTTYSSKWYFPFLVLHSKIIYKLFHAFESILSYIFVTTLMCFYLYYLSRATTNRKLKETVALELSFVNSNLQLLKEQLAELNGSVELYQNDR